MNIQLYVEIKHPKYNLFVRSDGSVRLLASGSYPERVTFGTRRPDGYFVINFAGKTLRVHRLVAEAFLPNPEGKPTVDHINRNPADNRVCNLRWATRKEQTENTGWYTGLTRVQYAKKWKEEHPEEVKEFRKAYRQKHKEELREKNRMYRQNNPDKVRQWRQNAKHKMEMV